MSDTKGSGDTLRACEGVLLPECSPDPLASDWSWLDSLNPTKPLLPEMPPPPSTLESLIQAMVTPDIALPEPDRLEDLPRELELYGPGEYLSPEAKHRAKAHPFDRLLSPGFPASPYHSPQRDRQKLIRHTEDILVKYFPLRAQGEQLYLCEGCIWKPISVNQLWRHLRASDLTQILDVDSFTDGDTKDLYRRLVTNVLIQLDDTNGGPMNSTEKYINLQDVCFHVITGRCCPQDPGYFFTSKLDICKDDLSKKGAPYFEEFVQTSLAGEPSLRQLLLEILGTLLSNYRPKSIFVFCGASNSGKSVLVDFLRQILGISSITQIAHLRDFSSRWTIGNLKGKKLLVCTECADESIGADACAVIKTITGEPVLTGEQKHKDATTFHNSARLLLVSNHLVRLDRVDAGFANRLVSLPFPRTIPPEQQDPNLLEHLLQEKGPIFMLAMQALRDLIDRNFAYTEIAPTYLHQVGEQKLHLAANFEQGIRDFVQTCCTAGPEVYVPSGKLYECYRAYAQANHMSVYTKSDAFVKALRHLYPTLKSTKRYVEGKQCRCLVGIALSAQLEVTKTKKEDPPHD